MTADICPVTWIHTFDHGVYVKIQMLLVRTDLKWQLLNKYDN